MVTFDGAAGGLVIPSVLQDSLVEAVIRHASGAIAVFDTELRYLAVSDRWLSDYQLPDRASIIGRCHYDIFPGIPERWKTIHQRCLQGESFQESTDFFPRENGRVEWLSWHVFPWYQDGEIGGLVMATEVITNKIEVEQSKNLLQSVIDQAPFAVMIAEGSPDEWHVTLVNDEAVRINGQGREQQKRLRFVAGRLDSSDQQSWKLLKLNGERWPTEESPLAQAMRGESIRGVELIIQRSSGEITHALCNAVPIRNQNHDIIAAIVTYSDISDRIELETELRKREQSMARAQTVASFGSWEWDMETNDLYWSDEIYRIFGLQPQEFAASYPAFLERIHPEDVEHVTGNVQLAIENPQHEYDIEHRIVKPDGTVRFVREKGTVEREPDGQPIRMTGVVQDITERKWYEEKLHLSRKVIESTSDGIIITDKDRRIVDINPAFERITGYNREELIGNTPKMNSSGRHDKYFYRDMWNTIDHYGFWQGEIWDRKKNGELYPQWLSINAVKNEEAQVAYYVGIFTDISRLKETQAKLRQLAYYDPLTELPNRALLHERMSKAIENAEQQRSMVGVVLLDLDYFKYINDSLGHHVGDNLLKQVGDRLRNICDSSQTLARLGGDEFVIMVDEFDDAHVLNRIAENTIAALKAPFMINEHRLYSGASVGISIYPQDATSASDLLKNADAAMYAAKADGRDQFRFFSGDIEARGKARLELETALRDALQEHNFHLLYQPKLHTRSMRVKGVEALVRWQRDGSYVSPLDFIPIAEETGIINPLGDWILERACQDALSFSAQSHEPIKVSVNLSAKQIADNQFLERVKAIIAKTGVTPAHLEFEITESILMRDVDASIAFLQSVKKMGIAIAMDDFGTGYSSLSYLRMFPIDTLKIDQSFVRHMKPGDDDSAIIEAVVGLSKRLRIATVAEGVETIEQGKYLLDLGVDEIQGYCFSRPVEKEAILEMMDTPHHFDICKI